VISIVTRYSWRQQVIAEAYTSSHKKCSWFEVQQRSVSIHNAHIAPLHVIQLHHQASCSQRNASMKHKVRADASKYNAYNNIDKC
jgi:hypothetical protein